MATGIVEVFAKAGYDVTYVGRAPAKVDGVRATIERSLDKAIQRGKLEESVKPEVLGRLTGTTSLDDLADADLVVEAIAEDLAVKTTLFENLDEICKPGAILATTTSSLPIISLRHRDQAAAGRHRDALLQPRADHEAGRGGLHRQHLATTSATTVLALCEQVGKVAVSCGDRAGFIVNALLFPYLNDAVKMLEAHYATADDIDIAMKQGCALPMGPFELLDVVGNDVSLAIQRELYLEFREPGFAPAPLLEHLVTAGYLGRKTQRGFRDYYRRGARARGRSLATADSAARLVPHADQPPRSVQRRRARHHHHGDGAGAEARPTEPTSPTCTHSASSLLTYVLSFVYIGIYWNNHHHLFQICEYDRRLGALGQPAPAVLALAVPLHDRLDGRVHFGAGSGRGLRREPAAGGHRVLPSSSADDADAGQPGADARGVRQRPQGQGSPVLYVAGIRWRSSSPGWGWCPSSWSR